MSKKTTTERSQLVGRIFEDQRKASPQLADMLGQDDPVFCEQAADLVRQSCVRTYQPASYTMQRLNVLLFNRFPGNETHMRSTHGFANGLGIVGIVLVGLDVGLHELRSDEPNVEPAPA